MERKIKLIYEIGHISIIIASFLSFLSIGVFAFHFFREYYFFSTLIKNFSKICFFFVLISFLILEYAFINSEFSLDLVVKNSHSTKPLIYKISGLWGNHEGSILLWILILSFFTYLIAKSKSIKSSAISYNCIRCSKYYSFFILYFFIIHFKSLFKKYRPPFRRIWLKSFITRSWVSISPTLTICWICRFVRFIFICYCYPFKQKS